jgi:3-oxoacyl-[acyl-carrier protein] reductase
MRKKTTLVTGANSDIGQYIVKALATKGLPIAAHYHKNVKPLERLKDELKKDAVFIKFFQYDLRKYDEAEKLVKNVIKEFNRLDVLVNTIGPFYYKNILDVSPEE